MWHDRIILLPSASPLVSRFRRASRALHMHWSTGWHACSDTSTAQPRRDALRPLAANAALQQASNCSYIRLPREPTSCLTAAIKTLRNSRAQQNKPEFRNAPERSHAPPGRLKPQCVLGAAGAREATGPRRPNAVAPTHIYSAPGGMYADKYGCMHVALAGRGIAACSRLS